MNLLDFGAEPLARVGDPDTSHAAARSVRPFLTARREAVLLVLSGAGPMTDEELHAEYAFAVALDVVPPQSASGLRTRRSELVDAGMVVDTGERRATASGRQAVVWAVCE